MAGIFKWVFENITPGETNAQKRIDADRIMDNFNTLATAASPRARGIDAFDGNSQGISTPNQCNIMVYTDQGIGDLMFIDDYVQITDGTNKWYLQNTLADDELSFNDTHLAEGSGPADYSDPAFIDSLEIKIVKFADKVGKGDLILGGSHAQKLTGSDIEQSSGSTTKIGAALPAVKTQVDAAHEADGSHKADVITISAISKDALIEENDGNIVFGMMEDDWDLDGYANGWKAYNDPTSAELSTEQSRYGDYSQKIVASQPEDGTVNNTEECPLNPDSYAGRYITAAVYVYCSTNDTVKVEIYDGVGTTTSAAAGTASAWERIYVTRLINAAASDLQVRIYATQATTFYIDEVHVCLGELASGFYPHSSEQLRSEVADASFTNYCPNSDFEEWSSGNIMPDLWNGTALITANINFLFGDYSAEAAFDVGETFYMDIPCYQNFKSRTVYFTAYVKLSDGASQLRMKIDDGVTSSYKDVAPTTNWQRRGVKHILDASATHLRIQFENPAGGPVRVLIDGVMLTVDSYPIGYKPATIYKPFIYTFGLATLVDAFMQGPGGVLTGIPVPFPGIVQSLHVRKGTAGTGADTFKLYVNGSVYSSYDVSITAANSGSKGVTMANAVIVAPGNYIQVYCDAAAVGAGANAVAVVRGITWA